jgi:hypothetical protein
MKQPVRWKRAEEIVRQFLTCVRSLLGTLGPDPLLDHRLDQCGWMGRLTPMALDERVTDHVGCSCGYRWSPGKSVGRRGDLVDECGMCLLRPT